MNSERKCCAGSANCCNEEQQRRLQIRQLNDELRITLRGGRVALTRGVLALGPQAVTKIILSVQQFDAFSADNDPYEEHDFGLLTCCGHQVVWKIDYYDAQFEFGSPDAADPDVTRRVMTIMLAEER